MDISVFIPIYNVEQYIEQCLRSLFNQSKTDGVEFVLVNDCSTDKSMEVVNDVMAEYPNLKVLVINNERNLGICANRMIALSKVRGHYCIQIDSDDWCEPTMLEDMYNKAIETNADFVNVDYYVNKNESQIYVSNELVGNKMNMINSLLTGSIHASLWTKFIKTSFIRNNNIRLERNFALCEDLAISIQLVYYASNIIHIPKAYYHYVQTESSLTRGEHREVQQMYEMVVAIEEIESFIKQKQLGEEMTSIVNEKKLRVKFALIRYTRGQEQKNNLQLFREVDCWVLKSRMLKWHKKILLFLATHGFLFIVNRFLFCYSLNKKLRQIFIEKK